MKNALKTHFNAKYPQPKILPGSREVWQISLPAYLVPTPHTSRDPGSISTKTCHLCDVHCKAYSPTCNRLPYPHQTTHNGGLSKMNWGFESNFFYFKYSKDEVKLRSTVFLYGNKMRTPGPKLPETPTEHTQAGKVRGGSADSFYTKFRRFLRQNFICTPDPGKYCFEPVHSPN